jgi:hypothetical protein
MKDGWGDHLDWRVACLGGETKGAGMGDTYSTAMHSAATCENFIFLVSECRQFFFSLAYNRSWYRHQLSM